MISNAAAYYHSPTIWVGSSAPIVGADVDVSKLGEEVYRTTLSEGITAKVLREGMFIFDFSSWLLGRALPESGVPDFDAVAAVILKRVTVLNAHLACLYTALSRLQNFALEKMVVSPSDLISLKSLDDTGMSFGDYRVAALALARYPSTYAQGIPTTLDWRIVRRSVIVKIETVTESFRLLSTILHHPDPDALFLADLHVRSCKAYEDHNYALCLVTAWTIAENLMQRLWNRYVDENRLRQVAGTEVVFINSDRRDKLIKSRDFTPSVISEILSLTNRLPFELYQGISKVRQARNEWLHDLRPVSRDDASRAVKTAEQMLSLVDKIDLALPLESQIHE
jgi:hypothetical protein